jgi:hypothetical protein
MTATPGDRPFFDVAEIVPGTFDPSGASIVHQDDYPNAVVAGD